MTDRIMRRAYLLLMAAMAAAAGLTILAAAAAAAVRLLFMFDPQDTPHWTDVRTWTVAASDAFDRHTLEIGWGVLDACLAAVALALLIEVGTMLAARRRARTAGHPDEEAAIREARHRLGTRRRR